jgi:hypothetical protein
MDDNVSARNRDAFDAGQAIRERIRALLASHSQAEPSLSAKTVRELLNLPITERSTAWHMQQIRLQTDSSIADTAIY